MSVAVGKRQLEVLLGGAPDGRPLVFHAGTPSPPVPWPSLDRAAEERGLLVVSPARPGYSGSTRNPGRSVADVVSDTTVLLDAIEADGFLTLGHSGGGPHALACAALLPDRCRAAVSLAGVVPYDAPGFDWQSGMGEENVAEFCAALQGESVLRPYLVEELKNFAHITGDQVAEALGGLITEVDRTALTGELAEVMAASLRLAAADGLEGWLDDNLAFVAPWGFDISSISVPVAVWHGRQDKMVPFSHGEWLVEHIPSAEARLRDDEGHLSLVANRLGDILDGLVSLA